MNLNKHTITHAYDDRTLVRACCVVGVLCSAWNLLGDLYFMDFFTAFLSDEAFGMIRDEPQSGYLFSFDQNRLWWIYFVQAGGWMYPLWGVATAIPLYIGFQKDQTPKTETSSQPQQQQQLQAKLPQAFVPIALLVYGLCVVGGAFHGAFAFITVLPAVAYYGPSNADEGWSDLTATDEFLSFLQAGQTRILMHVFWGGLPAFVALNVAAIWIAVLVQFRSGSHRFPKWFNFFNPVVTMLWVQVLGALLPDLAGRYLVGCLGTWTFLVLNLGTAYTLWKVNNAAKKSDSTELLQQYGTMAAVRGTTLLN